ncbi:hypothetical protein TcCL_ESM09519 [Trypanosoma cruzi]|nr:hypothetical protein TcCL_ESM09519 [Trypanosoma cruzi]
MVSNTSSCPRILTDREARWGSALAVFQDTNQSRIMVPSGSSVELLGLRPQSRANSSPLSTQVEKQHVASSQSGYGYIDPSLPLSSGAPASPLIAPQFFVAPESPCPAGFNPFATWTAASWRAAVGSMAPRRLLPPKRLRSSPR